MCWNNCSLSQLPFLCFSFTNQPLSILFHNHPSMENIPREFINNLHVVNKQGDNMQPWRTPFPIWNQCVFPCPVLTVASWSACIFLKRQVRWSGILIFSRIFHSLWWSTQSVFDIVNEAEIDVFLELSCFFDDPTDVGNLISGFSAFSKTRLNIRKFMVHVLMKPSSLIG